MLTDEDRKSGGVTFYVEADVERIVRRHRAEALREAMPPDPPTCASHGCDERPRHTSRGRSRLCDRCQEMQNDVIEQRNEEWWT